MVLLVLESSKKETGIPIFEVTFRKQFFECLVFIHFDLKILI